MTRARGHGEARGQHLIGKVLGSCELQKLLGYGGSSAVYLAQQREPAREVAVKVFLPRTHMDKRMQREFYLRFLREAEAASKLDHPNILPIYAYGEQDGLPYIVMPYMPGGTLSEYLSRHGPLSLEEAQWYLEQMALALDYAHQQGCIHCDIKPANMLLDSEGHILLCDFGIARLMQSDDATERIEPEAQRAIMGTPDYISHEQALGRHLDGRSDVYSLGITLFYLLTRHLPFKGDTPIALALMQVHEDPPSLISLRSDIPPAIDAVVRKALAKNPDDRFQTAGQFYQAFASAVAAATFFLPATVDSQVVRAVYTPVRTAPGTGRARLRLFGIAVALLAVIFAVFFSSNYLAAIWGRNPPVTTDPTPPPGTVPSTPGSRIETDLLSFRENWPVSNTFFYDTQTSSYHVLNKSPDRVALALYSGRRFGDFRLSVTMQELHSLGNGADYYGVVFRCSTDQSSYYLFEIVTSRVGQYVFMRYSGSHGKALAAGQSSAIKTGPKQNNTIVIQAQANTFTFHINDVQLGEPVADDPARFLSAGLVGLYVEDQGVEVVFSRLYIDDLR
ncbi:MAG: protein kinase [Ktedonobacteraceae bacterium]|nr:protein kinase [Ktedonobacteraceae bacterium]